MTRVEWAPGDHSAVVLDGVSQWFTDESGCVHGTVWYVRQLSARILHHAAGAVPLGAAVGAAIADVARSHAGTCELDHPWTPAATVAVLRETETCLEYLVLADCVIVVSSDRGVTALTDPRLAELLRRVRHPDATVRDRGHLRDGLQRVRNRHDGYWVAGSEPAAGPNAITGCVAKAGLRRIALLTDGASCLVDDYAVATWAELIDMRPEQLIDEVRLAERSDPDRLRWRRSKVHDDATVVFCSDFQ